MTREIKFRGKTESNQFIVGDLIQYENGDTAIFEKKITGYGYEATQISNRTKVYKETIGQYTGLKDCDGKEIYEGDFIQSKKYPESEPLSVEYNYGGFGYMYFGEFYLFGGNSNFTFKPFNTDDDFKIIGNIHDNPELIKTK